MQVAGKTVLITGASEGIGAACLQAFRARGAARLVLVARNRGKLQSLAQPGDVVVTCDLLDPAARRTLITQALAQSDSRLDILVNNAGIGLYAPSTDAEERDVRAMFELNFFAAIDLATQAVPVMRRQGSGCIVNVSSIAGRVPLPWFTLYSATKAALSSFTAGLRMELAGTGIHVMEVCPGYVHTDFQQHVLGGTPPEALRKAKSFAITPSRCARDIVIGVERDMRTVVTPPAGRLLIAALGLAPGLIESRLTRMNRGLEPPS